MTALARRPWVAQALIESPLGPMRLAATPQGLGGLWFEGQAHHPGPLAAPLWPEHPDLQQAMADLARYWRAPSEARFHVRLDLGGTPFQQQVWQALLQIAPGRTRSYAELARQIGRPRAVRAVGAAVGRNPVSLIVPCHRILGTDGSLTGYAGGTDRKRQLLAAETPA